MKNLSVKELFLIFCLITISVIGIIFFHTVGPKTWQAIKQMKIRYLLISLVLGGGMIFLDSLKLRVLSLAAGTKLTLSYSVETTLVYFFTSSITPTLIGGEPLMIYMLTEKKMPFGKATTIIFLRGVLLLTILAVVTPTIIFFHGGLIENSYIKGFFYYTAFLLFLFILFLTYSFFNPLKGEEVIHKLCRKLKKYIFMRKYVEKFETKITIWIDDFSNCLKEFIKNRKKTLIYAILLTIASLCVNFLIAWTSLRGLNYNYSFVKILMIQFVLYFFLYFTPTPGGTGVAEGGAYLLFSAFVPQHLMGIFIVLWRFFSVYLWVIVGGFTIAKTIGFDIFDKISQSKE